MSVEESKAVVQRYFEILNEGTAEVLGEVFPVASSRVIRKDGWSTGVPGLEELKAEMGERCRKHPTWRLVINDIIGEGDKVTVRWTGYEGDKPGHIAVVMFQVSDGKIVEDWEELDLLDALQRLDSIPAMA